MKAPQNETETHFLLKEIAKYVLWSWGYTSVASEVYGLWSKESGPGRNIIDALGAKKLSNSEHWDIKGIEAKATLADFNNGFCMAAAYTYIIAPRGVINPERIPDKVGFIEVDFESFELKTFKNKISFEGVILAKRAKKRIDERFSSEEDYRKWCKDMLPRISYRSSQELLFWRNTLPLQKASNG